MGSKKEDSCRRWVWPGGRGGGGGGVVGGKVNEKGRTRLHGWSLGLGGVVRGLGEGGSGRRVGGGKREEGVGEKGAG